MIRRRLSATSIPPTVCAPLWIVEAQRFTRTTGLPSGVFRPMLATQWADQAPRCTTVRDAAILMDTVLRRQALLVAKDDDGEPLIKRSAIPTQVELPSKTKVSIANVTTIHDLQEKVHLPPYYVSPKYDGIRCVVSLSCTKSRVSLTALRDVFAKLAERELPSFQPGRRTIIVSPSGSRKVSVYVLSKPVTLPPVVAPRNASNIEKSKARKETGAVMSKAARTLSASNTVEVHIVDVLFSCRTGASLRHLIPQTQVLAELMVATAARYSPFAKKTSMILDAELCAVKKKNMDGSERLAFEEAMSSARKATNRTATKRTKIDLATLPLKVFDVASYVADGKKVIVPNATAFPEREEFLKSLPLQSLFAGGQQPKSKNSIKNNKTKNPTGNQKLASQHVTVDVKKLVHVVHHEVVNDFRIIRRAIAPNFIRRLKVEGVVVRTAANLYEPGKRSNSMFKLVPWKSSEFVVLALHPVGHDGSTVRSYHHHIKRLMQRKGLTRSSAVQVLSKGNAGRNIWNHVIGSVECITEKGEVFRVPGTNISPEVQREWWANRVNVVGSRATVEFHSLNPSGIPRHPYVKAMRTTSSSSGGNTTVASGNRSTSPAENSATSSSRISKDPSRVTNKKDTNKLNSTMRARKLALEQLAQRLERNKARNHACKRMQAVRSFMKKALPGLLEAHNRAGGNHGVGTASGRRVRALNDDYSHM